MMVDDCTLHEQNPLIHLAYITTNIQFSNNGHKMLHFGTEPMYILHDE